MIPRAGGRVRWLPAGLAAAALLTLCLAAPRSAPAAAAPALEIEAPPSLAAEARRLRAIPSGQLESVVELVGLADPGPPVRAILAPEASPLARAVPPWIAGFARGSESLVVLFPERVPSYPDGSLEELLRHEAAHVLVERAAGGRAVPRWFHEGLALIAGSAWDLGDRTRLALALLREGEVFLGDLDGWFGGGAGPARRAYALSGAFVRDLIARHGRAAPSEILAGVRSGLPFEQAFHAATGETLEAAEAGFWSRQTFWNRWLPFLTSSATVWIAVTLLALWAIRRRRQRDAELRRRWEEEEGWATGAGGDEPVN